MEQDLTTPFIEAVTDVITMMSSTEIKTLEVLEDSDGKTWGAVTGLVNMKGDGYYGHMTISFDEPSILGIVNRMLDEKHTAVNDEIIDAVGELSNVISSTTRSKFSQLNIELDMALPLMISGKNVEISQLRQGKIRKIKFQTPEGIFVIETNLAAL
ncbi:MAG: chemotaxis protein CheX [Bdellovibrionales bacterium]|nr:chemotaxis protein CheX [Bdellovibrionales bacterium]